MTHAFPTGRSSCLLGCPFASVPATMSDTMGPVLGGTVLSGLAAVTLMIGLTWRRGCREARAFFLAWAFPMAVLAATQLFDMGTSLFGGGPQIAVLDRTSVV